MHKRATLAEIAKDPDALTSLDIADLRALWALHFSKKPASPNRGCLIRDLAWYAQAKFDGGFSNKTRHYGGSELFIRLNAADDFTQ